MKKTIFALAVLGAYISAAQAQVNIGGVVQANVKDYKVGNSTRNTQTEIRVDDDYNSRFWLTGVEDLGGGTSALFYIENRFNTDNGNGIGSGIAAGDTFFGLKGPFGQATIGRHSLFYGQGYATETVIGNGGITAMPSSMWATFTFMDFVGATPTSVSRVPNSIKYATPNMGGFTGSVGYSPSNSSEGTCTTSPCPANYSKGEAWALTGNYTNGPVYANIAYWLNNTEGRPTTITTGLAGNPDTRAVRLSGYYKLPFGLKLGLQLDRSTLKAVGQAPAVAGSDQSRTVWELPVSYAFGNSTILGSYSRAGSISGISSTGAKMLTLGYDYSLSKRTNLGVYFSKLKNDAVDASVAGSGGVYQPFLSGVLTGSALSAGESATTLAFGIKHTF